MLAVQERRLDGPDDMQAVLSPFATVQVVGTIVGALRDEAGGAEVAPGSIGPAARLMWARRVRVVRAQERV